VLVRLKSLSFFLGKHWKFVERRFLSPPREFKTLYGPDYRQTTLENYFVVRRIVIPVVKRIKKEKIYRQSSIIRFMKKKN
jgi:hypothetical protein